VLIHFLDDNDEACWPSVVAIGAEQVGHRGGVRRGAGRQGGGRGLGAVRVEEGDSVQSEQGRGGGLGCFREEDKP
jgi:hypothetical protein